MSAYHDQISALELIHVVFIVVQGQGWSALGQEQGGALPAARGVEDRA
jgi:hypothetical protein